MILTIWQFIEALTGGDERFRTLERVRTVNDEAGLPLFVMPGNGLVDMEVAIDGLRYTLRCPLRRDGASMLKLHSLGNRDRGLEGRFFTEWRLLENEIVLFDDGGEAFWIDILIRPTPEGVPLADYLEQASVRGEEAAVEAVSKSFDELVEWAANAGRSGISPRRLIVSPTGELRLTAFSANDESGRVRSMLRAAALGDPIPASPAAPQRQPDSSDYDPDGSSDVKLVKDGGGWRYVDGRGNSPTGTLWLDAKPFREGRAEVEASTGKGLIDRDGRTVVEPLYEEVVWDEYWGLVGIMAEGRWSLLDRDGVMLTGETYDWLGECSEGFVLAQRGGKCGFLDVEGRPAIPFVYDDASSFHEGYSSVSADGESFLIDPRGQKIRA